MRATAEPAGPLAEALPRAEIAFVGEVLAVVGPAAEIAVEEVWAGSVEETVRVTGMSDRVTFGEDDRHWVAGTTYLVVPFVDRGVLRDGICTATVEWSDELAALRPPDATGVSPEAATDGELPLPIVALGVAAAALIAISVLVFRRTARS